MTISVGDKLPDVKLVKATESGPEQVSSSEYFAGKKVALVRKTDKDIIAGVVTRVGDKVFDGSVQSRLTELREQLLAH